MNFKAGIESPSTMPTSSSSSNRRRKGKQQQQPPALSNSLVKYKCLYSIVIKYLFSSKSPSSSSPSAGKLEEKKKLLKLKKSHQEMLRQETAKIVIWRQPIRTIHYSILELIYLIHHNFKRLISYRKTLFISIILFLIFLFVYNTEGTHQKGIQIIESLFLWSLYWFGLGIASSVGLGTGLHTFLLYLGPFIAQVTLAAYECGSIKFPRPPYPNEIVCPSLATITNAQMISDENATILTDLLETGPISFWKILWKVKLEAFFWGLGTAIGELPPYFMARAARLGTNETNDDEELIEFEQLLLNAELHNSRNLSLFERTRYLIYRLIKRIGFLGILLCASIPNPLFDLAGITCGYFLIPFWTFFLATIIGKALIKMSIQTVFIIFLFSEHHVERIIRWMKHIPYYGRLLQTPFKDWLHEQKGKMHRKPGENLTGHVAKISTLTRIFNVFVAGMIIYFVASIINSLAQRYYKRTRSALKTM
jgi:membrane protein YqaA with SNARE-associated domain